MSTDVVNGPTRTPPVVLLTAPELRTCVVLIAALALVMTFTGACNTSDLGVMHRLALWLCVALLVVWQCVGLFRLLTEYSRDAPANRLGAAMLALPVTMVLTTMELHVLKFTPLLPKAPDPPLDFLAFVAPIAGAVAILALYLVEAARRAARPATFASTADDDRQPSTLVLPARNRAVPNLAGWPDGRILRVTVQDHYLDVHTPDGTILIRGRLRDALAKLAEQDGVQVHRSHWVAWSQMCRLTRHGRDHRLQLLDGDALPVSRARVTQLRARLADRTSPCRDLDRSGSQTLGKTQ